MEVPTIHDDELRKLGEKVDCRLDGFKRHARMGAVDLWEAGKLLNAAKALAGHGTWLPWLAQRCIEKRQAQYLMKSARELTREEVELAGSIRGAWSTRRQGQIRNVAHLPEADTGTVEEVDAVPYGDPEWREAYRASCMMLAYPGGMTETEAAALAWNDHAFRQWWIEGTTLRNMTDAEFAGAVEETIASA